MRRLMPWVVMAWLTWATWPSPSRACSCRRVPFESAFLRADLVAEVEILDVAAEADLDFAPQPLTVRVHRVFTAPRGIREGMTLTVLFDGYGCTVIRVPSSRIGQRSIMLFTLRDRVPVTAYCTPSLSPDEALPAVLEEARRRWLASR
ncbi:MAG: hypothetical protein H6722_10670 [Sandaracinus sp.]|nr:hypothetical protein [Myxococcales bacterium]MCB9612903.1 hypothetical protein [Sandaracinus sp.]